MRSSPLALALMVLPVTLAGCASGGPTLERFELGVTPGPDAFPDVPGVVLLDRGELALLVDETRGAPVGRLRRYRRVKVLRESGLGLGRLELPFEPGSRITGLVAAVVRPDGTTVRPDLDTAVEITRRDGLRAIRLDLPGVTTGAVIECAHDLVLEDLRFVAPWVFQGELPTVRSEFAVEVPSRWAVDLRFSADGAFLDRPPERFETEQGTRFSWSLSDLPALFPEEGMPAPELVSPRAHFIFQSAQVGGRTFEGLHSWDDARRWLEARMPGWAELGAATVAEARRVAGDTSLEERASKIEEVLTRDLAAEDGPPPPLWRARLVHPEAALAERRANPTTRGLLLVALLRAAGIEAVPALVAERHRDVLAPDVATLHGVTGIAAVVPRPAGALFLDPSDLTLNTDVPPPALQGTRAVALFADAAELRAVPTATPSLSRTEVTFDLALDARGDLTGSARARLTGAEAGALRARLAGSSPERYAEVVSAFLAQRGAPLALDAVSVADLAALRRPLTLTGKVTRRGAIVADRPEIEVQLGRLLGAGGGPVREVRRWAKVLPAPHEVELRLTLTLPEGHETRAVPAAAALRWRGGETSLTARVETPRRFGLLRKAVQRTARLDPGEYGEYRRYLEAVRAAEAQPLTFQRPVERPLEY